MDVRVAPEPPSQRPVSCHRIRVGTHRRLPLPSDVRGDSPGSANSGRWRHSLSWPERSGNLQELAVTASGPRLSWEAGNSSRRSSLPGALLPSGVALP